MDMLRLPAVQAKVGLSRSSIYRYIKEQKFPKPITVGVRAVGWVASEVDAWIASRIEEDRNREGGSK